MEISNGVGSITVYHLDDSKVSYELQFPVENTKKGTVAVSVTPEVLRELYRQIKPLARNSKK
jgi:hypothetical protein